MSKQIKIVLVAGAVLIAFAVAYLLWPAGEPDAPQRGVSLDNVAADDGE